MRPRAPWGQDPELLEPEAWDCPDRLSPDDCRDETGSDGWRTPTHSDETEDDR